MKKYSSIITLALVFAISTPVFYAFSTPAAPGGKDARWTLAILFSGMKNFSTCSGQFIVTGFDAFTKIPQCKTRDSFLRDYFKTQNGVVPTGNIVTGFDINWVMTSNSAQNMVKQVIWSIPGPAGSMQWLIGFTATNPIWSRDIGYWADNGWAGIIYDGTVNVWGFLGGQINTNEVKSDTQATASNHLMNLAQFMEDMEDMCAAINWDWDGSTCNPRKCTTNVPAVYTPMNHATWKLTYKDLAVPYGQTCKSENRFCRNGSLSGSYMQTDCYYWIADSFPWAVQSCGSETVSRSVKCMQSTSGWQVADAMCDAASKPPINKTYTHPACPIDCEWYWGWYSACSASCGPEDKTRTFIQTTAAQYWGQSCMDRYGYNDWDTQSVSCGNPACAPSYTWKPWSPSGCVNNATPSVWNPMTGYEDYFWSCSTLNEVVTAWAGDKYGSCPMWKKWVETKKCLP